MNDASSVRVVQRFGAFVNNLYNVVDAQQVVWTTIGSQRTGALDMFGYDVVLAVFLARVIDRHDVRMLQHANHVRFIEKHLARHLGALGVLIFFNVVDLDRDVAAVIGVV